MLQYSGKVIDPKKNITYGSCRKEHFVMFSSNPTKAYPLRVEMIGITYPDKDYFIERKHADFLFLNMSFRERGILRRVKINGRSKKIVFIFFNRELHIGTVRTRNIHTRKYGSIFSAML